LDPWAKVGEQAAVALATAGAHVVLACRGMEKAEAVAAAINSSCKGSAEALSLGTCARSPLRLR
jgi:NAD(P)-dependent dehydrogenase (short-subunit alcohol dehydrogenase family)